MSSDEEDFPKFDLMNSVRVSKNFSNIRSKFENPVSQAPMPAQRQTSVRSITQRTTHSIGRAAPSQNYQQNSGSTPINQRSSGIFATTPATPTTPNIQRNSGIFATTPITPNNQRNSGIFGATPTTPSIQRNSGIFESTPTTSNNQRNSGIFGATPTTPYIKPSSEIFAAAPTTLNIQRNSGIFESKPTTSNVQQNLKIDSESDGEWENEQPVQDDSDSWASDSEDNYISGGETSEVVIPKPSPVIPTVVEKSKQIRLNLIIPEDSIEKIQKYLKG